MSYKMPTFIPLDMNSHVGCSLTEDRREMVMKVSKPDLLYKYITHVPSLKQVTQDKNIHNKSYNYIMTFTVL